MLTLFDRIVNKDLLVKRINMCLCDVVDSNLVKDKPRYEQIDLFTDYSLLEEKKKKESILEEEENKLGHVLIDIKNKYGKNAILKGMNLEEGATTSLRNNQIGGHRK